MIQPLWRTVQKFLQNLNTEPPYDPAIPLLGMYPEKTIIEKDANVHYSAIHNSQETEAAEMSTVG